MLLISGQDNLRFTGMAPKTACQVKLSDGICRSFFSVIIIKLLEFKKLWTGMGVERSISSSLNKGLEMGIKMTRHVPLKNGYV